MTNEQIAEKLAIFLDGAAPYLGDDYPVIEAAIARLRAPAALPEGWQPIETAPKDGTHILLTNGKSVAQGWWEHQEPYVREKRDTEGNYIDQDEHDGFDDWLDCEGGMQPGPTYWMPLPAAPGSAPSGVSAPAAGVPAGYVQVPSTPTKAMQDAWDTAGHSEDNDVEFRMAYQAMLAAAPAANAQPGELPPLPKLPKPADTAYIQGPQGGEYRTLSSSYEPDCAMFSPNQMQAYARAALAHAQSDSAGDARDAARYRWARDNIKEDHEFDGGYYLADNGKTWDKTIDAAIAASAAKGEQR